MLSARHLLKKTFSKPGIISQSKKEAALTPTVLLIKIDTEFSKLAETPGMGKEKGIYMPSLRGWPFGEYVIFYRPISKGIEVIRVIHAGRETELQKYQ